MSNAVAIVHSQPLQPVGLGEAIQLAEFMTRGRLMPDHLKSSPSDCLLVIEQAMRWGMSPFAVAQATSSIKGKLMFEGKLVAAAVHSCGILDGRLDYEFSGSGDARKIIVTGKMRGEAKARTIEVTLKDARTDNGMWKKQPDQQLVYHGVRVWARRHCPEVMLGVYSPEEMEPAEPRDITPATPRPTMASIEEQRPSLERDGYDAALRGTDYLRTWKDALTKEDRLQVKRYMLDTLIPLAKQNDPAPEQQDEIDRALDNAAAAAERGLADEPETDELTDLIDAGKPEPLDETLAAQVEAVAGQFASKRLADHVHAYFDRPDVQALMEQHPEAAKRIAAARDKRLRELAAGNGGA